MTSPIEGPIPSLLHFVQEVYDAVQNLDSPPSSVGYANLLTMQWIRIIKYKDWRFSILVGRPKWETMEKLDAAGINRILEFEDPSWNALVRISHLFCTIEGILYNRGAPTTQTVNPGDFAGWGGDWVGFYAAWWTATAKVPRHLDNENRGDRWAFKNLASFDDQYDFHIRDWIADADAFNISQILFADESMPLPRAMEKYYQPTDRSGYKTRFRDFFHDRFASSPWLFRAAAYDMLRAPPSFKTAAFSDQFAKSQVLEENLKAPPSPEETLDFCEGFYLKLEAMIQDEEKRQ